MIYYTADLHLGYAPMLAHRPFESVQAMDETLIRNWNETVGPDDTVYIVGDFSYNGGVVPAQYFRRLQGRKHLIRGNHDTGLENAQALFEYCESVVDYWELDDGEEHACVQCISRYGIYCNYFKNAVLPADSELFAEIMQPSRQKRCQICKSYFVPRAKNQRYCPNCAAVQKRKKAAERQRRKRAALSQGGFRTES